MSSSAVQVVADGRDKSVQLLSVLCQHQRWIPGSSVYSHSPGCTVSCSSSRCSLVQASLAAPVKFLIPPAVPSSTSRICRNDQVRRDLLAKPGISAVQVWFWPSHGIWQHRRVENAHRGRRHKRSAAGPSGSEVTRIWKTPRVTERDERESASILGEGSLILSDPGVYLSLLRVYKSHPLQRRPDRY